MTGILRLADIKQRSYLEYFTPLHQILVTFGCFSPPWLSCKRYQLRSEPGYVFAKPAALGIKNVLVRHCMQWESEFPGYQVSLHF